MQDIADFLEGLDEDELRLLLDAAEKRLRRGTRGESLHVATLEMYAAAGGGKCPGAEQLAAATEAFSRWFRQASTPMQRRSRGRIWLSFLLIRFGGLRLGEVLSLDDRKDLDIPGALIFVRGPHAREAQFPAEVMREVAAFLEEPSCAGIRGKVFRLDPGYLRRKFYERAGECGLSRSLLNPSALRSARAVELLRGGVPLRAVQSFMGQASADRHAGYIPVSNETASRIVHMYLNKETKMKTSARNAFSGKVTRLIREKLLVEVELTTLSGLRVVSVITAESASTLALAEGRILTATVKAPWVILTRKEDGLKTSARNKYEGVISSVALSDLAAEVVTDLADGTKVVALVTRESADNLELKPGGEILVMFKAFSVILNAE
ncbi:MAG: TOBE domain-containing protein [Desulfovibrio sp.]|jgi:molybdate transport system regulatory protein|nr:TOBE domain-containing protein [Desulfovibrio sp.]